MLMLRAETRGAQEMFVSLLKEDGSKDRIRKKNPTAWLGFITIRFNLNSHKRLFHRGPSSPRNHREKADGN